MVGGVGERFRANPATYSGYFQSIGEIVTAVRAALRHGDGIMIGRLLDENHRLLQTLGVSSPELDRLVAATREAGAHGAKLSGGGGGGVMLALAPPECAASVEHALQAAGAARVIATRVPHTEP